ncbi:MAG: TGS domain-containing protein [Candidatus Diapherotrites archaeon]|nr:TGS domain-containing protein [Candidatus Diapherotrites archaeon]
MAESETTAEKEILQAIEYAKLNGAKQYEIERLKRVADELNQKQLPKELSIATILKSVANYNETEIEKSFGKELLELLKEIKLIENVLDRNYGKTPNETLSSLILSIPQDYKAIIQITAEVADALYKREKIINENNYAKKAEEVWYPLSAKLALGDNAWKIQDFSFRQINPNGFDKIRKLIQKSRSEREEVVAKTITDVEKLLGGKIAATIQGRPKGFKSIYEKLKKVPFRKMHDIYGIRIICQKEKECYEILGYLHSKYDFIQEAFDDYIAKPKPDGYKSIHTAVKKGNDAIEIQIRTCEQHLRTITTPYWNYKQLNKDKEFENELSWERQLIEWQKTNYKENGIKKAFGRKIFAFTPKNDAIALPIGASVIDFAFAVHTEIGKKTEKAKVNGKYVPLNTILKNMDKVEIITSQKSQLQSNWLAYAITEKARSKIKTAFGMQNKSKKGLNKAQKTGKKKVKLAECCKPLPGDDTVGVKTTKRKIILHKRNCPNLSKIDKSKLIELEIKNEKGKTEIKVVITDRPGILGEILEQIKNAEAPLTNTKFKIKKTGYAEAFFEIEIKNTAKLDKLMEKIEKLPGVHSIERI